MNEFITKQALIYIIIMLLFFILMTFFTAIFLAFFVRKNIEKKLNSKIVFPYYSLIIPTGVFGKYSSMAGLIMIIYLTEKRIIREAKYYKKLYLIKMKYSAIKDSKINIFVCFVHIISLFMTCLSMFLVVYVGSKIYNE